MAAIYKRDLRAYFTSPVGYVFIAAFVFVMCHARFRRLTSDATGTHALSFTPCPAST